MKGELNPNLKRISYISLILMCSTCVTKSENVNRNTSNFEETAYQRLEEDTSVSTIIGNKPNEIKIKIYLKEINNNHSYNMIIFNYKKDDKDYIIPLEEQNRAYVDYLNSSVYEKCRGKSVLYRVVNGSLYVLQIETPYTPGELSRYYLRKLEEGSDLPGDTTLQFSLVGELDSKRACKD
ncbi:hypothetical protein [Methylobacterium sp. 1030]|uniref:hypothetical protein n=1 Tax=Methylobacterium sp. 1030 TaxID=3156404 RepID=UPI003397C2D4